MIALFRMDEASVVKGVGRVNCVEGRGINGLNVCVSVVEREISIRRMNYWTIEHHGNHLLRLGRVKKSQVRFLFFLICIFLLYLKKKEVWSKVFLWLKRKICKHVSLTLSKYNFQDRLKKAASETNKIATVHCRIEKTWEKNYKGAKLVMRDNFRTI